MAVLVLVSTVVIGIVYYNIDRWYDYIIIPFAFFIGMVTTLFSAVKSLDSLLFENNQLKLSLLSYIIIYVFGITFYFVGNQLAKLNWLSYPLLLYLFLITLNITSCFFTMISYLLGGLIMLWINRNELLDNMSDWGNSIVNGITYLWAGNSWFQWSMYSIVVCTILLGVVLLTITLVKLKIIVKYKERGPKPMEYNGLYMTCPIVSCRLWALGEYRTSHVRGDVKST